MAASDKAVAEATEARETEKAKNAVTVDDAKKAQEILKRKFMLDKSVAWPKGGNRKNVHPKFHCFEAYDPGKGAKCS